MVFRDGWVSMAVGIERLVGRLDVNGVYIGKEGYLLEKYDPSDFDAAQIEENVEYLAAFLNDAVARCGKERVSCLLLPDKAAAMPDKLPEGFNRYNVFFGGNTLRIRISTEVGTNRSPLVVKDLKSWANTPYFQIHTKTVVEQRKVSYNMNTWRGVLELRISGHLGKYEPKAKYEVCGHYQKLNGDVTLSALERVIVIIKKEAGRASLIRVMKAGNAR